MTYQEFRDKYNGQWLDWDGQYGAQCWDLAQIYVTECLGVPSWVLSGCGVAKKLLYQPKRSDLDAYFDEVDVHQMDAGDVCIWDGVNDNDAGHIAVFDSWDGYNCWYFSQNPNPSQVMQCNLRGTMHAFRLRKAEPPKPAPEVTPNVERDEYKDQIQVKVPKLRVRTTPSTNGEIIGFATEGLYDYYEIVDAEGYNWYRIADNQWVAYNQEWFDVYPKKEKEEYVQFKVLSKGDGYVEIDLGKVLIREQFDTEKE